MKANSSTVQILVIFVFISLSSFCARAAERVAFIIGNDKYPTAPLENAVRDASAVNEMLTTKLKFGEDDVIFATNTDRIGFFESFEKFKKSAAGADIVLVYYAGHGMESIDGKENFIIPVDADVKRAVESEAALRATGINLMTLSADLAGATNGAKVILMDCCRERPAGRNIGNRSGGGLAIYEDKRIPADTLMILAAAPNRVASDGAEHGPFTEALLEVLPRGGQNLMDTFFDVSDRVQEVTQRSQVPWLKFDGSGRIFRKESFLAVASATLPVVPMKPEPPKPVSAADRVRSASVERPFVNSLGMEFVPVPGKPGVLMCRTETRVRDFRAYAEATDFVQTGGAYVFKVVETEEGGHTFKWELDENASWEKPGFSQTGDHPVVCVSWEESRKMADWLSEKESGITYRLPSDAEWSAAVGSIGKYPWGSEWPPPKGAGNYWDREGIKNLPGNWEKSVFDGHNYNDGSERTGPVASYSSNRFGFFDLGGNVWEWCEDQYRASMNDKEALDAYPTLKEEKSSDGIPYRVVRGGSWCADSEFGLRSSIRSCVHPSGRYDVRGFRLVVSVGGGG